MVVVVETFRKKAVVGDLKFLLIQSSAACDSAHTIDLGSDTFAGAAMTEILLTLVQDDAGQDEEATWVPGTGVVTMGTLSATGIHNILIIGY